MKDRDSAEREIDFRTLAHQSPKQGAHMRAQSDFFEKLGILTATVMTPVPTSKPISIVNGRISLSAWASWASDLCSGTHVKCSPFSSEGSYSVPLVSGRCEISTSGCSVEAPSGTAQATDTMGQSSGAIRVCCGHLIGLQSRLSQQADRSSHMATCLSSQSQ